MKVGPENDQRDAEIHLFHWVSGLRASSQVLLVLTELLRNRPTVAPAIVGFACPNLQLGRQWHAERPSKLAFPSLVGTAPRTYAPARGLSEKRAMGMLKSFSVKTGFGFIACPELQEPFGQDVFLHVKQMGPYAKLLMPGMPVTFAVVLGKENRPQAHLGREVGPRGLYRGHLGLWNWRHVDLDGLCYVLTLHINLIINVIMIIMGWVWGEVKALLPVRRCARTIMKVRINFIIKDIINMRISMFIKVSIMMIMCTLSLTCHDLGAWSCGCKAWRACCERVARASAMARVDAFARPLASGLHGRKFWLWVGRMVGWKRTA